MKVATGDQTFGATGLKAAISDQIIFIKPFYIKAFLLQKIILAFFSPTGDRTGYSGRAQAVRQLADFFGSF
ncbi:MAG: hypothetical protein R2794_01150 [Chitinophagales bacterium]